MRFVVADFNGGTITSDAGVLLLDKTEQAIALLRRAAECFADHSDGDLIEQTVSDLLRQRVFALALGYEDLNDHDELSRDPLHGRQEGRFFHGYYKHYCYLPLYAFCGEHLLAA
ncbi:MAG: transposase, partial [Planctomycetes bacterium]|nr:transposase [Planctomycetota bacterium]